jgi:hypothetical protein
MLECVVIYSLLVCYSSLCVSNLCFNCRINCRITHIMNRWRNKRAGEMQTPEIYRKYRKMMSLSKKSIYIKGFSVYFFRHGIPNAYLTIPEKYPNKWSSKHYLSNTANMHVLSLQPFKGINTRPNEWTCSNVQYIGLPTPLKSILWGYTTPRGMLEELTRPRACRIALYLDDLCQT